VNGVPSCANSFLLEKILRQEWGFEGFVVSDCGAVGYVWRPHQYAHSGAEAAGVCLSAGTDLNCGSFYTNMAEAIDKGFADEKQVDQSVTRLFHARMRLGMFDPWKQQPYLQYPPETVGHSTHSNTALQLARESIVLLKNENETLPLRGTTLSKIAVLGPHYDSGATLCGTYHGGLPHIISPIQAIKAAFTNGQVTGMKGCDRQSNITKDFGAAMAMAKEADVAILLMGIDTSMESEGNDRTSIALPGVQEEFIGAIATVQKNIVIVFINGGSIDLSYAKEKFEVRAILEAFYPGTRGGEAIADVLFGKYNPSGRLPYTVHKADFVDQIPMSDMSMTNYPGRTYRYFSGEAVYPFGFGLSYTTFKYETEQMQTASDDNEHSGPSYRARVTNSGDIAGDTSVLAFISFKDSETNFLCPKSQLFGFEKIHLLPGESKDMFFSASPAALRCYRSSDKSLGSPPGRYSVRIGDKLHEFYHPGHDDRVETS